MSPPVSQLNTFFEKPSRPIVEPISKVFIVTEQILGVNRLPLIATTRTFWRVFMTCYTIFLNLLCLYLIQRLLILTHTLAWTIILITDYLQFLMSTVLGFVMHKRLQNFYVHLNRLDADIGIKATKFGIRETVYNILQLLVTIVQSFALLFLGASILKDYDVVPSLLLMKLVNCCELHYYGHLFSLLILRLKVIKDCMKSSYPYNQNNTIYDTQSNQQLQREDRNSHLRVDMNRLMDFYNKIIIVYDSLKEAIKWQMLALLTSSFLITLCSLYIIVKNVLWGEDAQKRAVLLIATSAMSIQLLPFFVPCVFAERVHKEARMIKDYLACKLCDNTLNKPSRSTARSLLGLIEARNLSFSLFNMFDINMSLPAKFVALLLTYLVILLQFDKVMSPD